MAYIRIRGLKRLEADLERVTKRIERACQEAVKETADHVQNNAKRTVAANSVHKGNLLRGIDKVVFRYDAEVGVFNTGPVDLYYAHFVEYGTSKMRAEPFMRPAAAYARVEFPRQVREHVRRAL